MESVNPAKQIDLVLVGGGHSHALALKLWGINPLTQVRLTLISDVTHTPYSGMLPGYIAGFYSFEQTHIDLVSLSQFAKAQFCQDQAIGLDLNQNQVITANHPPIKFDFLSLDIGSTPATVSVPGATEYTIPAKPVPKFLQGWEKVLNQVRENSDRPINIGIVGGGVGGVELALNMQSRLLQITSHFTLHLFHKELTLLPGHNQWVSRRLETILRERGIKLHLQQKVREIISSSSSPLFGVKTDSGVTECDFIFWVTQASAPDWIKSSGLTTDAQGFIVVRDTLQSVSHPHIFATGDIGTIEGHPRPKAGVFAVRQGKPLYDNLQLSIIAQSPKSYIPQKRYLSLIGTGDKSALASWGCFGWESPLLWSWKDHIDRKFMRQFEGLS